MPTQPSRSASVQCPYFIRIAYNGRTIVCEGLLPKCETACAFKTAADMEEWMRNACDHGTDYGERCPLARTLDGKYKD